jgi:ABC-type glycerol-3-phosphate transport system substrate-binding protein
MQAFLFAALALLLTIASGCAGSTAPQASGPLADVTGTWHGTWNNPSGIVSSGNVKLELQQTGTKVTGRGEPGGDLEGTVTGNNFSYRFTSGRGGGDVTVNGDQMKGWGGVVARNALQLNRQR